MDVLVIGYNGRGLMPTSARKARILVREKKAVIERKVPFTIRLLYKTGSATQPITLGIDTGSQHIGAAIVRDGNIVLSKSEYELRSSMEKRGLLETRKQYRRGRRYRNTPFRKPKFKSHTKRVYREVPVTRKKTAIVDEKKQTLTIKSHWEKRSPEYGTNRKPGWLPPSLESKCGHHIRIIGKYMAALPDNTSLVIEKARFDIANIKKTDIGGEEYQRGRLYQEENIKAYVFSRDNYTCRICHKKAGTRRKDGTTVKLTAHHIDFKSRGATDNPDRMAGICDACHTPEAHKSGGILYEWMRTGKKFARGYRDMTHMNTIASRLRQAFPKASFTYGNITCANRKLIGLKKGHANDAVAIAMRDYIRAEERPEVKDTSGTTCYLQFRRKKRSLHEANPRRGIKEPNRKAARNSKNRKYSCGLWINDSVSLGKKRGWVQSFAGKKECRVVNEHGEYITVTEKVYTGSDIFTEVQTSQQ